MCHLTYVFSVCKIWQYIRKSCKDISWRDNAMKKLTLTGLLSLMLVLALLCPMLASCSGNGTTTTAAAGTTANAVTTQVPPATNAPDTDLTPDGETLADFAVISDVHIGRTGLETDPSVKFANALKKINSTLTLPDAILIVGDLTEHGYETEYKKFNSVLKKNTLDGTIVSSVMGNHEYYNGKSEKDARALYVDQRGDLHSDIVVGGVHMIGISLYSSTGNYKQETSYLCERVKAAAAEDPNMPIIVYAHMGFSDVYDDEPTRFTNALDDLIDEYPQIISFSGHMHYALNDPRMIMQNKITTVQTSTVGSNYWNYSYMDPLVTENGSNASQGLFVSVSKDKVITITRYDFTNDKEVGRKWVINTPEIVKSRDNFTYTEAGRKNNAAAPVFASGASMTVGNLASFSATITAPVATITDDVSDNCIIGYRFTVTDKESGEQIISKYVLNDWQECSAPKTEITTDLSGMSPEKTYIISVVAESAWDKASEPLSIEVTTPAVSGDIDLPDSLFCVDFASGSIDDTVKGIAAKAYGAPEVKNGYAVFNNNSSYGYALGDNFYGTVTNKFALETVIYIDPDLSYFSDYCTPVGNAQFAGFDICVYRNGSLTFDVNIGGAYVTATAADVPLGEWMHVVASYDGAQLVIYINSRLAATKKCTGNVNHVKGNNKVLYIGSDVGEGGTPEAFANVKIASVKLYGSGLDASQAAFLNSRITLPKD